MKIAVLFNHAAGSSANNGEATVNSIRDAMQSVGLDADIQAVEASHLPHAARKAADSGFDAVVAAGGDGTVSAVAAVLVGGRVPLGVLPMGTLNHFAKDLGLPLELAGAARVIAQGSAQPIDVGEVNGRIFLNNSSIGAYAKAVQERDRLRFAFGQSKWAAMARASLAVFRRVPTVNIRIESTRGQVYCRTPFVFVGNNRYDMHLFAMGARQRLDRGELSLYITSRTGRLALLRLAIRALVNRLDQAKDFRSEMLREFWVDIDRPSVHLAIDGEIVALSPPLHYRVRPGALSVLMPR